MIVLSDLTLILLAVLNIATFTIGSFLFLKEIK